MHKIFNQNIHFSIIIEHVVSKIPYTYNRNTFGNMPIYFKVSLITPFRLALTFIYDLPYLHYSQ